MIREVMSWKMWVVVHILKSTALERFRERRDLETRSLRSSSSDPGLKAARKYQASVKSTYKDALNDITALSHFHLGVQRSQHHGTVHLGARRSETDSPEKLEYLFTTWQWELIICFLFSLFLLPASESSTQHTFYFSTAIDLSIIPRWLSPLFFPPKHTTLLHPWILCLHLVFMPVIVL